MNSKIFNNYLERSIAIREKYHSLEEKMHSSKWTLEEDALAFITDAGLVGRNIMSHEGRWPKENSNDELRHKIGECMWWLMILAERSNINAEVELENFLKKTEKLLSLD